MNKMRREKAVLHAGGVVQEAEARASAEYDGTG